MNTPGKILKRENIKNFALSVPTKSLGKTMTMTGEFKQFLAEYKIVGLATAFIIGVAATNLVQSLVNNIVMPIITPFIPGGAWQEAKLTFGSFVIKWGAFLGALVNFFIIALVVFVIVRFVLRENKLTKK